ncbi:MAG TPA: Fe-S cluster assembly ATPase SufC [Planctomycetota bacterium]|nr:Fe-S cluster assembly ATPase SufC [Planctomycetota bacterium]
MSTPLLQIENLHVRIAGKEILKGLTMTLNKGEVHVLLGQNGTGKSTLAYAIAGHPSYEITQGKVLLDGEDLLAMEADERARKGVFLAFQAPIAVPGVSVANFLRTAYQARFHGAVVKATDKSGGKDIGFSVLEFQKKLMAAMKELKIDPTLATRYLNEGFSGGEKKQMEILQMAMLQPRLAMLDETDSGLDVDKLQVVGEGAARLAQQHGMGVLVITHYKRLLSYIKPTHAHLLVDGKIGVSMGPELVDELEAKGYEYIKSAYVKKTA